MKPVLPHLITILTFAACGCYTSNGPSGGSQDKATVDDIRVDKFERRQIIFDDLEWLTGEWSRVNLSGSETSAKSDPLGPANLESLEFYYPFGLGEPSLELHAVPDRKIVAEFFVRTKDGRKMPMDPSQPVMMGINKIVLGFPSPLGVQFEYKHTFDEDEATDYLELRSATLLLRFKKIHDFCPEDGRVTAVMPKDRKLLRVWKHQFEEMKFQRMNAK